MVASSRKGKTKKPTKRPDPRRAEAVCFGRTALVTSVSLLVASIFGWLRLFGLSNIAGSDLLALFGVISLTWLIFAFFLVLPTSFAVLFARRFMMRSRWHAYGTMAGLAVIWFSIVSLILQAFASVQTLLDLLALSWPSIVFVALVCILFAPWMVRDPSADPAVRA